MRAQAALGALLVALVVPTAAHAAGGDGALEPTIVVDSAAGAPVESETTLIAGRTYTIAVAGHYFETIPTTDGSTFTYTYDGVYCFEGSTPTSVCTLATPRLFDGGGLRTRIGATGSFGPFHRQLGASSAAAPAFREGHNYSLDFTAAATGRLQLSIARDLRDSYRGELHVTLYGPLSPDSPGPPGSGPSPELQDLLNSACDQGVPLATSIYRVPWLVEPRAVAAASTASATKGFCPTRLPKAPRRGRPATLPSLAPGDEALLLGPQLSAVQREETITISTSTGDVEVVLTEDDAKFRRYARRACLTVASEPDLRKIAYKRVADTNIPLDAGAFVQVSGMARYLLPCLRRVDYLLARASAAARSAGAGAVRAQASAAACRAGAMPIRVVAGRDLSTVSVRSRRSDPLPDALRVTCRRSAKRLIISVQPRRSGVPLRQLVGARLSLGLLRPPNAKGVARGAVTFGR